jgi:hypothetical protein
MPFTIIMNPTLVRDDSGDKCTLIKTLKKSKKKKKIIQTGEI